MKRKKRLLKGIESIKKQEEIHQEKLNLAKEQEDEELIRYYEHELDNFEKVKKKKQAQLEKQ